MLQEAIVGILINKMKDQYNLGYYGIAEKHIKEDSLKVKFMCGTVSNTIEQKKVSNANVAYYHILDEYYRNEITEHDFSSKYNNKLNNEDLTEWTEEQLKNLCEDIALDIINEKDEAKLFKSLIWKMQK